MFKRNPIWRVGNGRSVSFWQDHWIPVIATLADFAKGFLDNELLTEKVADYVTPEGDWDFLKLSQVLDEECL